MHRKILQKGIGSWAQKRSVFWHMWMPERPHWQKQFYIGPVHCGDWAEWTIRMPFWIRTRWSGPGVLRFFQNRRSLYWAILTWRFWIRPDMWIFLQRWSGPCRCWIMRCWSSAARTGCRDMWRHSGGCFPVIRSPPFCLSTRWTRKGQMRQNFFCSCKNSWTSTVSKCAVCRSSQTTQIQHPASGLWAQVQTQCPPCAQTLRTARCHVQHRFLSRISGKMSPCVKKTFWNAISMAIRWPGRMQHFW